MIVGGTGKFPALEAKKPFLYKKKISWYSSYIFICNPSASLWLKITGCRIHLPFSSRQKINGFLWTERFIFTWWKRKWTLKPTIFSPKYLKEMEMEIRIGNPINLQKDGLFAVSTGNFPALTAINTIFSRILFPI